MELSSSVEEARNAAKGETKKKSRKRIRRPDDAIKLDDDPASDDNKKGVTEKKRVWKGGDDEHTVNNKGSRVDNQQGGGGGGTVASHHHHPTATATTTPEKMKKHRRLKKKAGTASESDEEDDASLVELIESTQQSSTVSPAAAAAAARKGQGGGGGGAISHHHHPFAAATTGITIPEKQESIDHDEKEDNDIPVELIGSTQQSISTTSPPSPRRFRGGGGADAAPTATATTPEKKSKHRRLKKKADTAIDSDQEDDNELLELIESTQQSDTTSNPAAGKRRGGAAASHQHSTATATTPEKKKKYGRLKKKADTAIDSDGEGDASLVELIESTQRSSNIDSPAAAKGGRGGGGKGKGGRLKKKESTAAAAAADDKEDEELERLIGSTSQQSSSHLPSQPTQAITTSPEEETPNKEEKEEEEKKARKAPPLTSLLDGLSSSEGEEEEEEWDDTAASPSPKKGLSGRRASSLPSKQKGGRLKKRMNSPRSPHQQQKGGGRLKRKSPEERQVMRAMRGWAKGGKEEEEEREEDMLAAVFGSGGSRGGSAAVGGGAGRGGWINRRRRADEEEEEEEVEEYVEDEEEELDDFIVNDEISEDAEELQDFSVRCRCGREDYDKNRDAEELWIECTNAECAYWVHGRCFGIVDADEVPPRFRCHVCDPKGRTRRPRRRGVGRGEEGEVFTKKERKLVEEYPELRLYYVLERGEEEVFLEMLGAGGEGARKEWEVMEPVGPYRMRGLTLLMVAAAVGRVRAVQGLLDYVVKRKKKGSVGGQGEGGRGSRKGPARFEEVDAKERRKRWVLARDKEGQTAAHHAVDSSRASPSQVIAILSALLTAAVDVDDEERGEPGSGKPAAAAAANTKIETATAAVRAAAELLMEGDKRHRNLFHLAALRHDGSEEEKEVEEEEKGEGKEERRRKEEGGGEGGGRIIRWLVDRFGGVGSSLVRKGCKRRDDRGQTPLAVACDQGVEEEGLALLEAYPEAALTITSFLTSDLVEAPATGLMMAISRGMKNLARAMIPAGGPPLLEKQDGKGETVLHIASAAGEAELVGLILDQVPDIIDMAGTAGNQATALHHAALAGHTEVVVTLLGRGARPDVRDASGWSPLLYADFTGQQDCILSLLAVKPDSQLVVLGELLNGPRRHDARVVRILKSLTAVPSYVRFINGFVRRRLDLLATSLSFLLDQPELLDLGNKMAWLEKHLNGIRQEEIVDLSLYDPDSEGPIVSAHSRTLRLSRAKCWWDFRRICNGLLQPSAAVFLRSQIMFQFNDHTSIGPGVEREVLEVLVKGMVEEGGETAIFDLGPDESSYVPKFPYTSQVERGFRALGCLMGHCLLWRKVLAVHLNPCFLKLVHQPSLKLEDLQELDETLYNSLKYTLETPGASEALDLNFTWTVTTTSSPIASGGAAAGGGGKGGTRTEEIELCPKGNQKAVTEENKAEYVALVVKYRTQGMMGQAAQAMREGMCTVLRDEGGRLLRLFTAQEFSVLIGGIHDVDPSDWQRHSEYYGYSSADQSIRWFWSFVNQLFKDERALLLKFSTGTSGLPVGGFEKLNPPFTIQRLPYDPKAPLPMAATCFNTLKLPSYPSEALLEKNVLLAIRFGCEGFSFT